MRALILLLVLLSSAWPAWAGEPLRIVYYENFEPFSWTENGRTRGILIDVLDEALHKRLGLEASHEGYPWERAQDMVRQGLADGYATVPTPARLEFSDVGSQTVTDVTFTMFVNAANPRLEELLRVRSLEELKAFTLGHYTGSGWAKKNLADHKVFWTPRLENVLEMLANGRFDGFVDVSQVVRYYVAKLGYSGRILELPHVYESSQFKFFIGKKSRHRDLLPRVDAVLDAMHKDGTWQRIHDQYR
ncbi:MAG: transporter substrate-binding domain-containing protein [Thermodesulfobacteriota bacterium]